MSDFFHSLPRKAGVWRLEKFEVIMTILYKKANIHWNYFLAIENDFEKMTRYVELSESNDKTFSIEFARIIMAATQEVDVILKKYVNRLVAIHLKE